MDVTRVLLVEPRGFRAEVETAVAALAWVVALEGPPVYCLHEIVHNDAVADRFRRLGVVFVDDVDVVPMGATLVLSAHGTSPSTAAAAAGRASVLVDAVCPLVSKVHREIQQRARAGYTVLYAGRPGHDESVGALGIVPEVTHLVANPAGCSDVVRVDGPEELPARLSATVAVTAGASAPESAVAAVDRRLAPRDGVHTVRLHQENERFALPRELRTRISAAIRAGTLPEPLVEMAGREPGEVPLGQLLVVLERASGR